VLTNNDLLIEFVRLIVIQLEKRNVRETNEIDH